MTTSTDGGARALVRLFAWLSPSFPVGGFSYSHALERAVEVGAVHDAATLTAYVSTVLEHGSGAVDAALFRHAWHATSEDDRARLDGVVELGRALRGSAELALESSAQGAAFVVAVDAVWPALAIGALVDAAAPPPYAVAVALAAAKAKIAVEPALAAFVHAFAAGLVLAGVKLVPLGQTDGQRVIAALESVAARVVDASRDVALEELGAATPLVDVWSMQHETQYTRLFRS